MSADGYPIKLVRDKIRDLEPNVHDGTLQVWAVGSTTKKKMLRQKLLEEVGEYLVEPSPDELADILEVVESLAIACHGVDFTALRKVQLEKRRERGGFRHGHVMFGYPAEDRS